MTPADERYVRGGRAIGEWLITLFAFAAPIRRAAENAVSAMFYGLRSADLDFSEGMPADTGARARASEDAVRTAANAPDFPAGQLVRDAVRRMRANRAEAAILAVRR